MAQDDDMGNGKVRKSLSRVRGRSGDSYNNFRSGLAQSMPPMKPRHPLVLASWRLSPRLAILEFSLRLTYSVGYLTQRVALLTHQVVHAIGDASHQASDLPPHRPRHP
jgi:hypothetical protein